MELSEKVGLAIGAAGVVLNGFQIFFPGVIGKMTGPLRTTAFTIGTGLIVVGLVVVFFWPNQKPGLNPTPTNASASGQGAAGINNGTLVNNFGAPEKPTTPSHSMVPRPISPLNDKKKLTPATRTPSPSETCAPGSNCSRGQNGGISIGTQNNGLGYQE